MRSGEVEESGIALRLLLAAVLVVGACLVGGCGGSGGVIAEVGGRALSGSELDHWVSVAAVADGGAVGRAALRGQALDLLILSRWLAGEAREQGVSVSRAQVASELDVLRFDERDHSSYEGLPREPVLRRLLLSARVATPDRLWLMRITLLSTKVEQVRHARAMQAVSVGQVVRFYREHKREFVRPARREMEFLGSYSRHAVVRAKREIEGGKPFLKVASRVNVAGEAPGGLWNLVRGTDEAEVEDPVFAAKPHVLRGPFEHVLYFIFRVLKAVPAHQLTLAEVESTIRDRLARGVQTSRLTAAFEAKWVAKTTCQPNYTTPMCSQYRTTTALNK